MKKSKKSIVIAIMVIVLIVVIGIIALINMSEREGITWCTPRPSSMAVYGNMLDTTGAEKHTIYGKTVDVCCYEGVIQYQEEEWVQSQDKAMIQFGKLGEGKGQGKMKYCLGTVATEEYQIGWAYNEEKGQWLKYKEGHSTKDDVWEACTKIFDHEGNVVEEFCYQP